MTEAMTEEQFIAAGGDPRNNGTYVRDEHGMLKKMPAFIVLYDGKTAAELFAEAKKRHATGLEHTPIEHVKTYLFTKGAPA